MINHESLDIPGAKEQLSVIAYLRAFDILGPKFFTRKFTKREAYNINVHDLCTKISKISHDTPFRLLTGIFIGIVKAHWYQSKILCEEVTCALLRIRRALNMQQFGKNVMVNTSNRYQKVTIDASSKKCKLSTDVDEALYFNRQLTPSLEEGGLGWEIVLGQDEYGRRQSQVLQGDDFVQVQDIPGADQEIFTTALFHTEVESKLRNDSKYKSEGLTYTGPFGVHGRGISLDHGVDNPMYSGDYGFDVDIVELRDDRRQSEVVNIDDIGVDIGYDGEDIFKNLFENTDLEEIDFSFDDITREKLALGNLPRDPISLNLLQRGIVQKDKKRSLVVDIEVDMATDILSKMNSETFKKLKTITYYAKKDRIKKGESLFLEKLLQLSTIDDLGAILLDLLRNSVFNVKNDIIVMKLREFLTSTRRFNVNERITEYEYPKQIEDYALSPTTHNLGSEQDVEMARHEIPWIRSPSKISISIDPIDHRSRTIPSSPGSLDKDIEHRSTYFRSPASHSNSGESRIISINEDIYDDDVPFEKIKMSASSSPKAEIEKESDDFLRYVTFFAKEQNTNRVSFLGLLKHTYMTKGVAIRAFLHVLVLSGVGMISPIQTQSYGDIELVITSI